MRWVWIEVGPQSTESDIHVPECPAQHTISAAIGLQKVPPFVQEGRANEVSSLLIEVVLYKSTHCFATENVTRPTIREPGLLAPRCGRAEVVRFIRVEVGQEAEQVVPDNVRVCFVEDVPLPPWAHPPRPRSSENEFELVSSPAPCSRCSTISKRAVEPSFEIGGIFGHGVRDIAKDIDQLMAFVVLLCVGEDE